MTGILRIGLIAENHYPRLGGMELQNHWLALAFQRQPGTQIAVACSAMPDVPRDFPYPYPVYRHRSLSVLTSWLAARSVQRMTVESRANLLHGAMLHGGGYRAVRLARRLHLPVAVQAHGADLQTVPEINYGAQLDTALARKVRYTLRYADLVSVPSAQMRQAAIDIGADAAKIRVVPPGIDPAAMDRIPFEDMRARFGIAPDAFLVVTVGRNRPIKRIGLLLEALRLLAEDFPKLRCLAVGPKEELPEMIRRLGLEGVVVPLGPVPPAGADSVGNTAPAADLVNIYRAADAYVATSYRESFGLAALEALSCGVPAVVTSGQGVADVIVDGVNGFVLTNQTDIGVADGIRRAIALKTTLDRIRVHNSVAHLTWDHAAKRLREAYVDILERSRAQLFG